MRILLVEPFFTGSHREWALGFQRNSAHDVELLTMPGVHWKWRMHGAAITLSERFRSMSYRPDLILATDMLDLATFLANCRGLLRNVPVVVYFHENQITYPWSASDTDLQKQRDNHYGFINYTSALLADRVFFNSNYHRSSFLEALPGFLRQFPDHRNLETIPRIAAKSEVMHLGLDLVRFDRMKPNERLTSDHPVILWNHRWEYDKNPEAFFKALGRIKQLGVPFRLVVMGEQFNRTPEVFHTARHEFRDNVLHWGYAPSVQEYAHWLWQADLLPVTSVQDFFGGSTVEAMFCHVEPLLPDRLAYPEHIPEDLRHRFLYRDGELVDRMVRCLTGPQSTYRSEVRACVGHYDWSHVAPQMDAALNMVRLDQRQGQNLT